MFIIFSIFIMFVARQLISSSSLSELRAFCYLIFAMTTTASRGKLSIFVILFAICGLGLVAFLYGETISSLSSYSVIKYRACRATKTSATSASIRVDDGQAKKAKAEFEGDDKLEFDPDICDISDGKWVFNSSNEPLYSDSTCPYLDRQVSCVKNGRPESDYLHWEWQPDECTLPRFNPKYALRKLRGRRLLFVGDSLQRGQWQSFVCLVQSVIPDDLKSMKRGRVHSVFRAKEYNATVEFYWAPFLIESNSDVHIIGDPKQRILKVDSIAKHAQHWLNVDILVFGTYVWWMSGFKIKSLWGSFANGEEGYEELEAPISYRLGLKTWANWVDSTVNPNRTRVFFTSMSPTHTRSADWNRKNGTKCFNETRPIMKKGHWGSGSNKQMMNVVVDIMKKMQVPVTVINITQISEYRIDAHTSVYTETGGKLLNDEQKADPLHHADCIHWCLPGVPDSWNQIFLTFL